MMHWVLKDIKSTSREYWLIAQGVPSFLWHTWKDPSLFSRVPHHCQICGDAWRPDKDNYVAVMGRIIETAFGPKWFCEQLGLVRSTGHLDSHLRYVCRDCGTGLFTWVVDCTTARCMTLRPRKIGIERARWKLSMDVKYWTLTVLKFISLYFGIWAMFARQPRHFIKCRKAIFNDKSKTLASMESNRMDAVARCDRILE